jgi:MFS superfamily sulfate permease-like transporter
MVRSAAARPDRARLSILQPSLHSLRTDLPGGLATAIASLAFALTFGMVALAPLGPERAELGIRAGLIAAIVGNVVAAALSGTALPVTGPRASITLVQGAFVAGLAADPALGVDDVLVLSGLCVACAGAFQVLFGALRIGTLVKFVPYPVVAGFMCGVAVLIVLAQLPHVLGVAPGALRTLGLAWVGAVQPWTAAVSLATAVIVFVAAPRSRRLPAALIGLAGGTALYYALRATAADTGLGPTVGALPTSLPLPTALGGVLGLPAAAGKHLFALVTSAVVIAIIGALDSLLGAAAIDNVTETRHQANRELVAQGLGNLASAVFGGCAIALSPAQAIAGWRAGGRSRVTSYVSSAALLALMVGGTRVLAAVPIAVLAGIMLVVALNLIDTWTRSLLRRLFANPRDRFAWSSAAVVVLVAGAMVGVSFVFAVVAGIFLSMALFIAAVNRSLVRTVHDGTARPSRRVYGPAEEERLAPGRSRIKLVELQGALFFGSTERLSTQVEALAKAADYVVLDLRRVTDIDATGALVLEQLVKRQQAAGVHVALAGITTKGRLGSALLASGTFLAQETRRWFVDADRAIEWAELRLLREAEHGPRREIPLEQLTLMAGLDQAELAIVREQLKRQELNPDEVLFREGESGNRLYVLARGAVSIVVHGRDGADSRLVTFAPGSLFGEAALFDGNERSASAIAAEDAVVYSLSRTTLSALAVAHPALANKLLFNLGRHLSGRLRQTTASLRELGDSAG